MVGDVADEVHKAEGGNGEVGKRVTQGDAAMAEEEGHAAGKRQGQSGPADLRDVQIAHHGQALHWLHGRGQRCHGRHCRSRERQAP